MDMGILLKTPSGAICTLSLSFNNDGPIGSFFRYICDNGTYQAYYDDLADGKKNPVDLSKVDVSMDGIELEDREFIAAIRERREPNCSARAGAALHGSARPSRTHHRSQTRMRVMIAASSEHLAKQGEGTAPATRETRSAVNNSTDRENMFCDLPQTRSVLTSPRSASAAWA